MTTRADAIHRAEECFDSGEFRRTLARRVAMPTESQNPERADVLRDYLEGEVRPAFEAMGFQCRILQHPKALAPFLYAERIESPDLPTVLGYGHGDVIRGLDREWKEGLSPWTLTESGGRWYGRGIADNKGQHTVNMEAMRTVLAARGKLGFNAKYLIEMGEETGSAGLRELCTEHKDLLRADLLIASDGPRLSAERPTVFLGSRGSFNFDLTIEARDGGHHSGNWGGLISNPGIQLAHAIASISSPTGQIRIPEWVPKELPAAVRRALADCEVDGGADGPTIEPEWGEPGPDAGRARVRLVQLRGARVQDRQSRDAGQRDPAARLGALPVAIRGRDRPGRDHSRAAPPSRPPGLSDGQDRPGARDPVQCHPHRSRTMPGCNGRWPRSRRPAARSRPLLPNLGGSLPNDIFTDVLGLRTIWVPHSYPGCSQHAPNEHLPPQMLREGLPVMAGLYWDLGAGEHAAALTRQAFRRRKERSPAARR